MRVEEVLALLKGVRKAGAGWLAFCPAHDDRKTSLSVGIGSKQDTVLRCFAGCPFPSIEKALGVRVGGTEGARADMPQSVAGGGTLGEPEATYPYYSSEGQLLFEVQRFAGKEFRQRHRGPAGDWIPNRGHGPALYRLPELLRADPQELIYVVEGEKDVDALVARGFVSTTSGGAGSWDDGLSAYLRGHRVAVLPDNDEAGRKYAASVRASTGPDRCTIINLPDLPDKGDVTDWFSAGHTADELRLLCLGTQPKRWKPLDLYNADLPRVEGFLADRVFCRRSVGLIVGRREAGKTWLILSLARAIASGSYWGPYSTRRGRVLILSQEMVEEEIRDRLRQLFTEEELREVNNDITIICREAVRLEDAAGIRSLREVCAGYDVVFIDSFVDVKGGVAENDNDEIGRIARSVRDDIASPLNCAVIFTHHMGRPNEEGVAHGRGASALEDAAADIIEIGRHKGSDVRRGGFAKVKHRSPPTGFVYSITEADSIAEISGRVSVDISEDKDEAGGETGQVKRLVEYIAEVGSATTQAVMEHFSWTKSGVTRHAGMAAQLGMIEKHKVMGEVHWMKKGGGIDADETLF